MGRNIDIQKVLAQVITHHIKSSIRVAISRFEASDLTFILELSKLIDNARLCHQFVAQLLPIDSFDRMLTELDESNRAHDAGGKILSHCIKEIITDIIPNFCFNSSTNRFVRSPVFYAPPVERPPLPKSRMLYLYGSKSLAITYASYFSLYKDFLGECHLQALGSLLGHKGIKFLVNKISKHLQLIVNNVDIDHSGLDSKFIDPSEYV